MYTALSFHVQKRFHHMIQNDVKTATTFAIDTQQKALLFMRFKHKTNQKKKISWCLLSRHKRNFCLKMCQYLLFD